jgi:hypothetical protein
VTIVVCPVCEHQQAFGLECEVCGKELGNLAGLGSPPVAAVVVEGLEVTVPARIGDVVVERVEALEATALMSAQAVVPLEVVPDLDPGKAAPVPPLPVERMVDLSLDRAPDDGLRTPAPTGPVTCRYCRNVQAAGSVCNTCGMRLPKAPAPAAPQVKKGASSGERSARCRACGAKAVPLERCSDCGAVVPEAT